MITSDAMRRKIESWEGLFLSAYQDSVGVWTIGYGHTGRDVHPGQTITQVQADQLLSSDLRKFEVAVDALTNNYNEHQHDALVSFAFNLGAGALASSTLLKMHRAKNYPGAAAEFVKWNHAGGQVLRGLTRRRQGESAIYLVGNYTIGDV